MVATKRNIPVELLRRSARRIKCKPDESFSEKLKGESLEPETIGGNRVKRERDPNSPAREAAVKRKTTDSKTPEKLQSKSYVNERSTDEQVVCNAEGFLELNISELDLERTLLGGQSFRWTKTKRPDSSEPVFTGIVLEHALRLWRISPETIAFERLNACSETDKGHSIAATRTRLEDYFQTRYRLRDLYTFWSQRDEHLSDCCKEYTGFRILRQDPVENLFSFICATNNNIKRISQMVDKLCRTFGTIIESKDNKSIYDCYYSFPSVERLSQDDVFDCLRYQLGFGYRAKFIVETAKQIVQKSRVGKFASPRDYLLSLRQLSYKETCKELMQFQGIGRKVADCICLMSMDHLNSVPIDCHIYEIVCRHYMPNLKQERKTLTESVHDMIAEHFHKLHGPLSGWSTSVLFIAELKHLKVDQNDKCQLIKPKVIAKPKTKV